MQKIHLRESLKSSFEQTLDARVDRYLEIDHNKIIGNAYFAKASSECIELYRDGHYIGTVMMSQAVNEGIIKFLSHINKIKPSSPNWISRLLCKRAVGLPQNIKELQAKNIISDSCEQASTRICRSYRNDIHHMNPSVAAIDFQSLAKKNLSDLAIIEQEIWKADIMDGKLSPHKPQYWDYNKDGTVSAFVRFE